MKMYEPMQSFKEARLQLVPSGQGVVVRAVDRDSGRPICKLLTFGPNGVINHTGAGEAFRARGYPTENWPFGSRGQLIIDLG